MKVSPCEKCGSMIGDTRMELDGLMMCQKCYDMLTLEEIDMDIPVPKVAYWVGKISTSGPNWQINIPKAQRPMLRLDIEYTFYVKPFKWMGAIK